jgi:hypothetical protein
VSILSDLFPPIYMIILTFNSIYFSNQSYGIPVIVACISAVLRWFTDAACSAQVCRATSNFLSHTHAVGWFFLAILAVTKFQQIKDASIRTKKAIELMMASSGTQQSRSAK